MEKMKKILNFGKLLTKIYIPKIALIFLDYVFPLSVFCTILFICLVSKWRISNNISKLASRLFIGLTLLLLTILVVIKRLRRNDFLVFYKMRNDLMGHIKTVAVANLVPRNKWCIISSLFFISQFILFGILVITDFLTNFEVFVDWIDRYTSIYLIIISDCVTFLISKNYDDVSELYQQINYNCKILINGDEEEKASVFIHELNGICKRLIFSTEKCKSCITPIIFAIFVDSTSAIIFLLYFDVLFSYEIRNESSMVAYLTAGICILIKFIQLVVLVICSENLKTEILKLKNYFYKLSVLMLNDGPIRDQMTSLSIMYMDYKTANIFNLYGQFELDGSLLVTILSEVLSYIIVFIQLRQDNVVS